MESSIFFLITMLNALFGYFPRETNVNADSAFVAQMQYVLENENRVMQFIDENVSRKDKRACKYNKVYDAFRRFQNSYIQSFISDKDYSGVNLDYATSLMHNAEEFYNTELKDKVKKQLSEDEYIRQSLEADMEDLAYTLTDLRLAYHVTHCCLSDSIIYDKEEQADWRETFFEDIVAQAYWDAKEKCTDMVATCEEQENKHFAFNLETLANE